MSIMAGVGIVVLIQLSPEVLPEKGGDPLSIPSTLSSLARASDPWIGS